MKDRDTESVGGSSQRTLRYHDFELITLDKNKSNLRASFGSDEDDNMPVDIKKQKTRFTQNQTSNDQVKQILASR